LVLYKEKWRRKRRRRRRRRKRRRRRRRIESAVLGSPLSLMSHSR
jgi:hypothetical protein